MNNIFSIGNLGKFMALGALLMIFSSCDEELDMDEGNVTQVELNREKYAGIPEEFFSGKEKDWEHELWGDGLSMTGCRYTCFQINFPKCKDLYATVPMYKKVDVTANGIKCKLRDMLAEKYGEDIYLEQVTVSDLLGTTTIKASDLDQPWSAAYGKYEKTSKTSIEYTFPLNPSYMERSFTLKIRYSKEYPSFVKPDSMYIPEFNLLFEQMGNRNHLSNWESDSY